MKPNKDTLIGAGAIIVVVILLGWIFAARVASHSAPAKTNTSSASSLSPSIPAASTSTTTNAVANASATTPRASATTSTTPRAAASAHISATIQKQNPLPIDKRDTIASWTLTINENAATKEKLQTQIKTLTGDIGTGRYPDFSIYTQIAQYYALLGNGKSAYDFYIRAAENDQKKGVPFSDIGNLMEELGAYHTAQNAYAKSVALQPHIEIFWLSYLRFLSAHEATAASTKSIFAAAKKATGLAPNVLIAEANWRAQTGDVSGAIVDWKLVRAKVSAPQQSAIDAEIAKLEKQP